MGGKDKYNSKRQDRPVVAGMGVSRCFLLRYPFPRSSISTL